MDRSIRLPFNLFLDVETNVRIYKNFSCLHPVRFRLRIFGLGRKHHHMTIISLCLCGLFLNIRTPSMAD